MLAYSLRSFLIQLGSPIPNNIPTRAFVAGDKRRLLIGWTSTAHVIQIWSRCWPTSGPFYGIRRPTVMHIIESMTLITLSVTGLVTAERLDDPLLDLSVRYSQGLYVNIRLHRDQPQGAFGTIAILFACWRNHPPLAMSLGRNG